MHSSKEEELKQVQKELLILNIIDMPATVLVGLGLFAVFGADGDAIPSLLNDKNLAYGAIVVGGSIMAWCLVKMFPLLKKRAQLANEESA